MGSDSVLALWLVGLPGCRSVPVHEATQGCVCTYSRHTQGRVWRGSIPAPGAWQRLAGVESDCSALLQVTHLPGHARLGLDDVALCLQILAQLYT